MVLEIKTGQIVISKKGNDKGHFYVVTGFSKDRRLISVADGIRYRFNSPKMKNRIHLQPVNAFFELPVAVERDEQKSGSYNREVDVMIGKILDNWKRTRRLSGPYGQQG